MLAVITEVCRSTSRNGEVTSVHRDLTFEQSTTLESRGAKPPTIRLRIDERSKPQRLESIPKNAGSTPSLVLGSFPVRFKCFRVSFLQDKYLVRNKHCRPRCPTWSNLLHLKLAPWSECYLSRSQDRTATQRYLSSVISG
ncbi:hypothetical protein BS17DRAFT_165181 [Gyrodon lividus]|nr:hypothetical protein BS17DRAFT_165181 [Gyrodon lividus]